MNNKINPEPRAMTMADLCEAIYSGKLNVTNTDDYYMIKMRDLVQLSRMVSPRRVTSATRREQTQPLALAS